MKCFNSTLTLRIQMFARLHMVTQSRRTIQSATSLSASPMSRLVTKNPPGGGPITAPKIDLHFLAHSADEQKF